MRLTIILLVAAIAISVSVVSGLSVSGETVSSNLTSGNAMSASLQVDDIRNFPSDNYLTLTTDLTSPIWSSTTVVDGSSTSLGSVVNITGSQLAFPNATTAVLQISLTGIIPSVTTSSSKIVIQLKQFDASGNQVGGTYLLERTIEPAVTPTATPTPTPTPPTTGNISVTSIPSSSNVYLDLVYQGITPYTITGLAPGNYTVVVRRSGYVEAGKKIYVTNGTTETYAATLLAEQTLTTTTVVTTTTATPAKTATNTPLVTFTPWPSDTPTPESPVPVWISIVALGWVVVSVLKKK